MNKAQEINDKLREAVQSGKWCLAVFHVDSEGTIHLHLNRTNFATTDLERASAMLSDEAMKQADFDFLSGIQVPNADPTAIRPSAQPGADRAASQRLVEAAKLNPLRELRAEPDAPG